MIRSKTAVLARDVVGSISIQRELREVMRFMTKSVIERMLDAEKTTRGVGRGCDECGRITHDVVKELLNHRWMTDCEVAVGTG